MIPRTEKTVSLGRESGAHPAFSYAVPFIENLAEVQGFADGAFQKQDLLTKSRAPEGAREREGNIKFTSPPAVILNKTLMPRNR
jgi:hypothetical protein